jgi:methionyl aminopeptidase
MMIEASSKALENSIKKIKPGSNLSNIGKIIEETILSYGYKPIDNLTGHSLAQYQLHSGISIPNISNVFNKSKIKIGDILAIEPFATNGRGHVVAGNGSNIYICKNSIKSKLIRDYNSKIIFNKIIKKFKTLPFAQRWCENLISNCNFKLKKLVFLGLIKHYPQLIEKDGSIVTQKEHTIIVTDNGCEVITK